MSLVDISINEQNYQVENKSLLIDILIENKIQIPYFCYHEALGADGNCRMCMVEIEGMKRPQIACDTFVKDGMIVRTHGTKIDSVRQRILELELINHPIDCPICDQAGECKLQDYYMDYGLYDSKINKLQKVKHKKHTELGSNVMLDQERCVLCARCVRFTSNITKTGELGIINRADHSCVSVMPGYKLDNPYAMNVIDLCPVGALTSKDFRFHQRVWFLKSSPSVCQGCATGCSIFIDHNKEKYKDDVIFRFRPRVNKKINGHFICDYGRLSYKKLGENRQLENILNSHQVSPLSAIEVIKTKIKSAKNITILADANLYNEDLESILDFAKIINASVICPIECYVDTDFADDWLRSEYKCSNIATIKNLEISQALPDNEEIDLLINFNHPDFVKFKPKQSISFQAHKNFEAALVLAIPVYTEYNGTLVNEDGISQFVESSIVRVNPIMKITDWLHKTRGALK